MPRHIPHTLAATVITLLAASASHADVTLFNQPLDPDFFGGTGSNARNHERFAEGFTLDDPAHATTVRWQGHKSGPFGSGPITSFELRFYNPDGPGGAPGSTLYQETFPWDDLAPEFSRELGGITDYSFTATLTQQVPLPANQLIWLHVGGISLDFSTMFVWSKASTNSGYSATDAFDPGWMITGGLGSTFEVIGMVAPTPAAVALFPLAALATTRRGRN